MSLESGVIRFNSIAAKRQIALCTAGKAKGTLPGDNRSGNGGRKK